MSAGTKQCSDCGEVKPLTDFPACRTCRDGRRSHCLACNIRRARVWREQHPERHKATVRDRRQRLLAQGICTVCGRHPAVPGNQLCETCGEKQSMRSAEWYRNLAGERREAFLAEQNTRTKARYARLKAEGICPHCRKRPATPGPRGGMTHCDECRAEKRRQREARHHDRA